MKSTLKPTRRATVTLACALISVSGLAFAATADSDSQSDPAPVLQSDAGGPQGRHGMQREHGERGHHGKRGEYAGRGHHGKHGERAGHGGRGHHDKYGSHGGRGHHGKHSMKMMLKGLDLAEAQRDQIFGIRHAAMPAMRDASKKMRAARKSLRELALQGNASNEAIAEKTDALKNAVGEMASIRTRMMADVVNVLNEEQASKLRERMAKRGERSHGRGKHRS